MNKAHLLLGSNMNDPLRQLSLATDHLGRATVKPTRYSGIYRTAAWGDIQQADFLNQVLEIETPVDAPDLLQALLSIESSMGRQRTVKNAPRIIDIDILFFNNEIIHKPQLTIPHPQMQYRRFVLVPLDEIAPGYQHPVLHKTVHQLLAECSDPLPVHLFRPSHN